MRSCPPSAWPQSHSADTQARYDANTQAAIDAGVFGAPTYVIDGEMFWGQDRILSGLCERSSASWACGLR
jgi:2-hydroxychromene-2-carboxylate isomerase